MQLVKLAKTPTKIHVTRDGVKTVCDALIRHDATLSRDTSEWYKHTNCYNCAYRLWRTDAPAGYICPVNGKDFPIRKACPHGREPRSCPDCTPSSRQSWAGLSGDADSQGHGLRQTLHREEDRAQQPLSPDGLGLADSESAGPALQRVTPGSGSDMSDYPSCETYASLGRRFASRPGEGPGRVLITVPGVEDLVGIARLLQRAGAVLCGRRTFVVEGSLTVSQAVALMELAVFRDGNSDGNQLEIQVEGVEDESGPSPLDWWEQQQRSGR